VQAKRPDEDPDLFQHLLHRAHAGCREALGHLLEACRPRLLRRAERELPRDLRSKADGADLVQETLLAGSKGFGQFRGQTHTALLAWLRGILHNLRVTLERTYRHRGKRQVSREVPLPGDDAAAALPDEDDTPNTAACRREEAAALVQLVARLPPPYREVVQLHQFEGLPLAEVARRLGYSVETTRKLWSRAVQRLAGQAVAAR
jgi:RNA polymerase sigma-70 factor (ECF subfamily)